MPDRLPSSSIPAPAAAVTDTGWVDYVHAPVFILNAAEQRVERSNAALRRLLPEGLPDGPTPLATIIGAGAAEAILAFLDPAQHDEARRSLSVIAETGSGPRRFILHLAPLPTPDHWAVTVDEHTLFFEPGSDGEAGSEATFRRIIQALPIGIDLFDPSWRGIFFNGYSDELYQYDPYHDTEHHEWFERAFPDADERAEAQEKWRAAQGAIERDPSEPQHLEWRVLCRDGQYRTLHNMMSKIGTHYAFIYWDISEQRRLEDELRRLATTDVLTGLANRRRFFETGEALFAEDAEATPVSLLLLALDRFKALNDTFGHHRGDEALVAVARLATEALRPGELAARFGGEEFALLLSCDQAEAETRAESLRCAIAACRLPGPGGAMVLSTSIGLATRNADSPSLHQLIEHADRALYAAKHGGRNRVVVHQAAD